MSDQPQRIYLTREGLRRMEDELHELRTKGRTEIAKRIAEARAHGDLRENAEYDAAKEAQGHLELRIRTIEVKLTSVQIIDNRDLPTDKVYILSKVKLKDLKTNRELTYTLVSQEEANFEAGKISVSSPIGKGLLGRTVGEVAEIKVPVGMLRYEVMDISR